MPLEECTAYVLPAENPFIGKQYDRRQALSDTNFRTHCSWTEVQWLEHATSRHFWSHVDITSEMNLFEWLLR